jgi:hypothetical protein
LIHAHSRFWLPLSWTTADLEDLIVAPDGRLLLAGRALSGTTGNNHDFAVARLESAALFLDGFETGDRNRWSASFT